MYVVPLFLVNFSNSVLGLFLLISMIIVQIKYLDFKFFVNKTIQSIEFVIMP